LRIVELLQAETSESLSHRPTKSVKSLTDTKDGK